MRKHREQLKAAQEQAKQRPELVINKPLTFSDVNRAAYDTRGEQAGCAEIYNPLPRLFSGIKFRNAAHRGDLGGRIIRELTEQRERARYGMQSRFDEKEKALLTEIERLKNALELEQARHRADIFNFASGRNPLYDEPEATRKYRPALGA